jgi:hypothetical protein
MDARQFRSRRARGAALRIAAAVAGLSLAMAPAMASAAPDIRYLASMDGDQEFPGPGDADGSGFASIGIDAANGSVCWNVDYADVDGTLTGMHIHDGDPGVAGPIVVTLNLNGPISGVLSDCISGIEPGVLAAIVADPGGHFINLHSSSFPAGAIRGQIQAFRPSS